MEDINHLTGDMHAITTAHNALSALLDNHLHQGNELGNSSPPHYLETGCGFELIRALRRFTIGLASLKLLVKTPVMAGGFEIIMVLWLVNRFENWAKRHWGIVMSLPFMTEPQSTSVI